MKGGAAGLGAALPLAPCSGAVSSLIFAKPGALEALGLGLEPAVLAAGGIEEFFASMSAVRLFTQPLNGISGESEGLAPAPTSGEETAGAGTWLSCAFTNKRLSLKQRGVSLDIASVPALS